VRQATAQAVAEQIAARNAALASNELSGAGSGSSPHDIPELTRLMIEAAEALRFEEAGRLRDRIRAIEARQAAGMVEPGSAGRAPEGQAGAPPIQPKRPTKARPQRRR
jgi:excinuclease UvrABC nuclease subunit